MMCNARSMLLVMVALLGASCSKNSASVRDSGGQDGKPLADVSITDAATVQPVKGFTCLPNAVTKETVIRPVGGLDNTTLAIRPTTEACQFDLLLRSGNKVETLSSKAGGYLLAAGTSAPSGDIAICASNIDHGSVGTGAGRRMHGVSLECVIRSGGKWTALTTVVDGGESWAAWIETVAVSIADPSAFTVTYKRDFSFQFLNLGNAGRPSTDGTYRLDIRVEEGALVAAEPAKTSTPVWDTTKLTQQPWEPTAAELQKLAPYITKTEGSCPPPNGCPQP